MTSSKETTVFGSGLTSGGATLGFGSGALAFGLGGVGSTFGLAILGLALATKGAVVIREFLRLRLFLFWLFVTPKLLFVLGLRTLGVETIGAGIAVLSVSEEDLLSDVSSCSIREVAKF